MQIASFSLSLYPSFYQAVSLIGYFWIPFITFGILVSFIRLHHPVGYIKRNIYRFFLLNQQSFVHENSYIDPIALSTSFFSFII